MIEFTIWLILKFWPNRFSSVKHYQNSFCSCHFYTIGPKVKEFCLLYSQYLLVPSFKLIFKFWLMIL
jgi:hypothetical protein